MKRKIIITFDDDDLDAREVLSRAGQIVARGYKSVAANVPHYSWVTTWDSPEHHIMALTKIKKSATSADSIEFIKEIKEEIKEPTP